LEKLVRLSVLQQCDTRAFSWSRPILDGAVHLPSRCARCSIGAPLDRADLALVASRLLSKLDPSHKELLAVGRRHSQQS